MPQGRTSKNRYQHEHREEALTLQRARNKDPEKRAMDNIGKRARYRVISDSIKGRKISKDILCAFLRGEVSKE